MNSYEGGEEPHPDALYYYIAVDALEIAKKSRLETDKHTFRRKQAIAAVIVFSALCLETFINREYAAHTETSKIIEDDPTISLQAKWLILPLLLASESTFNKGENTFQTFHNLVFNRNNRLVHFKPKKEEIVTGGKVYKDIKLAEVLEDVELAESYVNCVREMILKLHELTSEKTSVPSYLDGTRYFSRVWVSAKGNIESL